MVDQNHVFEQHFDFTKFSCTKIVWLSCQICVTSLMSFSQPNARQTFSSLTIRKVTFSWYDFVKESSPNSSYRSPKRRNETVTQKCRDQFLTTKKFLTGPESVPPMKTDSIAVTLLLGHFSQVDINQNHPFLHWPS